MNFLLINFSPSSDGACAAALEYAEKIIEKDGHVSKEIHIKSCGGCLDCGACHVSGRCIDSQIAALAEVAMEADAFIIAAPVHYGMARADAMGAISKLLYSARRVLRGKTACVITCARRAGAICSGSAIETMLKFAEIPIACGNYPVVLFGSTRDEIQNDAEGLQNIRSAIGCLIWLSECIKCGSEAEKKLPAPEGKIKVDIHRPPTC